MCVCPPTQHWDSLFLWAWHCEVVAAERLSSGFGVTAASFTSGSASSLHWDYIFTSSFDSFLACSVGVCCFVDYRRGGAMKMKRAREAKSLCFGLHATPSCARQRWKNDLFPAESSQQLQRCIIMVNIAWVSFLKSLWTCRTDETELVCNLVD